ncbi:inovirus Gp2 family protein, partial [Klebsiella pneumoniae]|nr:inovirus Gp2 family protein [Klebsiella pneumoniae]
KACVLPENPASYRVVRTKSYLFNKALRNLIVRAWYSALRLETEDCRDLVHFPDNCQYVLNVNDPDFDIIYNELLERLDYLTKLDTKVFGEGDRSFGCSRG